MDWSGRHPAVAAMAGRFAYAHLPQYLQAVSKPFHDLAVQLTEMIPDSPELVETLRKLWETKNCAVIAASSTPTPPVPPRGARASVTELSRASLHEARRLMRDDPAA